MTASLRHTQESEQAIMNDKRLRVDVHFPQSFLDQLNNGLSQLPSHSSGVCVDSRVLEKNDVFFALNTEAGADGHDYVKDALDKGASVAVISKKMPELDQTKLIEVKDSLSALQALALRWRQVWGKTLIAITGSNGKTSSKYLTYQLLRNSLNITPPRNSWNNALGVPLSLLSIKDDDEAHILEIGMNHPGEIFSLCALSEPDIAGITNVGHAHIGFFENIEGIANEKKQVFHWLAQNKRKQGIMIINSDDAFLNQGDKEFAGLKQLCFSTASKNADVYFATEAGEQYIHYGQDRFKNTSTLPGQHNQINLLFALTVAYALEIDPMTIQNNLKNLYLPALRLESILINETVDVMVDCYNANLDSSMAAVDTLSLHDKPSKILVMGEMAENGKFSRDNHVRLAKYIEDKKNINNVFCFGKESKAMCDFFEKNKVVECKYFTDKDDLLSALKPYLKGQTALLFKGSRSNTLETMIDQLKIEYRYRSVR